MRLKQDIYRKKLCGVQYSITMADFLVYETQHPIIVIIYSSYFLLFRGSCRTLGIYST